VVGLQLDRDAAERFLEADDCVLVFARLVAAGRE
jgi:hypothetical protein